MPFALAIIGIVLLVSAIRGTSGALFSTLKSDFTGQGNFLYWVIAILVVGSVGYVKKLQPLSSAFLILLIIVLFISNKGFFSQFQQGISGAAATGCVGASSTSAANTLSSTVLGNQAVSSSQPILPTFGVPLGEAFGNGLSNTQNAINMGASFLGD